MKHLQSRTALKIGALYGAAIGSLLDLVTAGARAIGSQKINVPVLSTWMRARLASKGFRFLEGAGGFASGASLIVLGVMDIVSAREAYLRNQKGMMVFYSASASSEMIVGGAVAANAAWLIFRGAFLFAGASPMIFALLAIILVAGVVVELEEDPATMAWIRQCLWGRENNYQSETEEIENFKRALG